ncbi:MAG: universal stress protein [Anaerolineae bacterium]
MIQHILVPLDGSYLSEAALPAALTVARATGALVTLLHVIESNAPSEIHGYRHIREESEAREYLAAVANQVSDVNIKIHVHADQENDTAHSIVDHEYELKPDLIVMCTHGSGGIRDILFGSVAQQVAANGKIPVLIIKPEYASGEFTEFKRTLMPLLGYNHHQSSLQFAGELVGALKAELSLLLVIPSSGGLPLEQKLAARLLPGATRLLLEQLEGQGQEYLREQAASLPQLTQPVSYQIAVGEPVSIIEQQVSAGEIELVVLGTRGKPDFMNFGEDNTAYQICTRLKTPILLVPEQDA